MVQSWEYKKWRKGAEDIAGWRVKEKAHQFFLLLSGTHLSWHVVVWHHWW